MKIDTLCVQGGWSPKCGEPRQVPIYSSTTFKYDTTQHMADLFDLKAPGYFYTRLANPTNDEVAKKIAALDWGEDARDYRDVDFKGRAGLVIGAEGRGVSRLVRENCDFIAELPMPGGFESLNAGVAAAVAMYEILRQRR